MVRALITGGAGFVGSHLAEYLLAQGQHVTIIDDLSTGQLKNVDAAQHNPNFQLVIEDIRNQMVIDRLVSECDVVYHLAAALGVQKVINEPLRTIEVNIGGTEAILGRPGRGCQQHQRERYGRGLGHGDVRRAGDERPWQGRRHGHDGLRYERGRRNQTGPGEGSKTPVPAGGVRPTPVPPPTSVHPTSPSMLCPMLGRFLPLTPRPRGA